jgi:hypothetical protein
MAKVILSEGQNFLSESGNYSTAFLCANKPPKMLNGWFDEFFDDLGDIAGGVMDIAVNAVDAAGNIIQGAGQGVGQYVSNPNNIAQIGGVVATGLTGVPVRLTNQQTPQNFMQPQQDPLQQLLQNPVLLIGGAALIYLLAKRS